MSINADGSPTIFIENPGVTAVFSRVTDSEGNERVKVFYDLDALLIPFVQDLLPKTLMAKLTGDEDELNRCQGANFIVQSINLSREALVEHASSRFGDYDALETAFGLPDAEDPFAPGGGGE